MYPKICLSLLTVFAYTFTLTSALQNITNLQSRINKALDSLIPGLANLTVKEYNDIKHHFLNDTSSSLLFTNSIDGIRNWTAFGTLWCGPGTAAKSYDELGPDAETDKCCRAHDNCRISIDPGETKCEVRNNHMFAMSLCSCDEALQQCLLARAGDLNAEIIGFLFGLVMDYCVQENSPGKCSEVQEKWNWSQFVKLIMNRTDKGDLVSRIGSGPILGYKCLSAKVIYSGDANLDTCQVTCAIHNPFDERTETLNGYDCSIMRQLCCIWSTDFCHDVFPMLMGTTCPEQPQLSLHSSQDLNNSLGREIKSLREDLKKIRLEILKEIRRMDSNIVKQIMQIFIHIHADSPNSVNFDNRVEN